MSPARCRSVHWMLVAAAVVAGPALAQPAPVHVALGMGPGTPQRMAVAVSIDVGQGPVLQGGLALTTTIESLDQNPVLTAFHVGAGWAWPTRWGRARLGAGPAWMIANDRGTSASNGVGVVVDGVASVRVVPRLGVGVGAYAMAGTVGSGAGLMATVAAGTALR